MSDLEKRLYAWLIQMYGEEFVSKGFVNSIFVDDKDRGISYRISIEELS